jgi:hypothetical protein
METTGTSDLELTDCLSSVEMLPVLLDSNCGVPLGRRLLYVLALLPGWWIAPFGPRVAVGAPPSMSGAEVSLQQPLSVVGSEPLWDGQVEPVQMLLPSIGAALGGLPRQSLFRSPPSERPAATAGVALGLASVPFMIGDTGAGTCLSLRGIVTVDIAHPTLTCSRLNISENNTALPVDRFYYSYRHFHNSTGIQAFQYQENYNLDRHLFGLESTFWDEMGSVEIRLPLEQRLRSDMLSIISPPDSVVDVLTGSDDREVDVGNLSIITKLLLLERQSLAVSAGLGITVPTARDVSYDIGVRDTIIFPIAPGVTGDTLSSFENDFENETVYLSPFLAWLLVPDARWYHQGFLQVEVAANPSTLITDGGGVTDFFFGGGPIGDVVYRTPGGLPTATDIFAQTLLRVNLGLGYRLSDRDPRRWISNVNALFEMHYTTTLQRANISTVAIEQIGTGAFFPQFGTAGNANSRADILNVAAGLSANVGRLIVTNGVVAPIRSDSNRGFDFEYNLQVQLPF